MSYSSLDYVAVEFERDVGTFRTLGLLNLRNILRYFMDDLFVADGGHNFLSIKNSAFSFIANPSADSEVIAYASYPGDIMPILFMHFAS